MPSSTMLGRRLGLSKQRADQLLNPSKHRARQLLNSALKRGDIVSGKLCSLCEEHHETEAHHLNYEYPLAVIWLCRTCHNTLHTVTA